MCQPFNAEVLISVALPVTDRVPTHPLPLKNKHAPVPHHEMVLHPSIHRKQYTRGSVISGYQVLYVCDINMPQCAPVAVGFVCTLVDTMVANSAHTGKEEFLPMLLRGLNDTQLPVVAVVARSEWLSRRS
jgi:hypothetical protein